MDKLTQWSSQYAYKTSTPAPPEVKNVCPPGYAGYIPRVKSESLFGRPYSAITREALQKADPVQTKSGDADRILNSHQNHPCWANNNWTSTNASAFRNPKSLLSPTYRDTPTVNSRPQTALSGFHANRVTGDGFGLTPHPVMHGRYDKSEYRDHFNAKKDYHRDTHMTSVRQMKKKQLNYKHT